MAAVLRNDVTLSYSLSFGRAHGSRLCAAVREALQLSRRRVGPGEHQRAIAVPPQVSACSSVRHAENASLQQRQRCQPHISGCCNGTLFIATTCLRAQAAFASSSQCQQPPPLIVLWHNHHSEHNVFFNLATSQEHVAAGNLYLHAGRLPRQCGSRLPCVLPLAGGDQLRRHSQQR